MPKVKRIRMSSRRGDWWCRLVARSVADYCPQNIGSSACERQHGLLVPFPLGALAFVIGP